MSRWQRIAFLANTKTLDGRLVARALTTLPFLLREGMEVYFVPPALDAPRKAVVQEVLESTDDGSIVRFSGIDSIDLAKALVGSYCLASYEDIKEVLQATVKENQKNTSVETPFNLDQDFSSAQVLWRGWEVFDQDVSLGIIRSVKPMPAQALLEVQRLNASQEDAPLLIPLVKEFIERIDEETGRVFMKLPQGLLDL